jgi:hypothetical protein
MKRHDNELLIKATASSKGLTLVYKEARMHNTGFASGGVTCKLGALCFYSSGDPMVVLDLKVYKTNYTSIYFMRMTLHRSSQTRKPAANAAKY